MKIVTPAFLMILLLGFFGSCTKDRDVSDALPSSNKPPAGTPGGYSILHYWNFNDNSNDVESVVLPTYTLDQKGKLEYKGNYWDDVNEGTLLNAKNGDEAKRALRLRNPAGDFLLYVPTKGYKSIKITYAAMRTSNGAQEQIVSYTTDGTNYISTGLSSNTITIEEDWKVCTLDFSAINAVNNNTDFIVKISFGTGSTNDSGNDRIDNLAVEGIKL